MPDVFGVQLGRVFGDGTGKCVEQVRRAVFVAVNNFVVELVRVAKVSRAIDHVNRHVPVFCIGQRAGDQRRTWIDALTFERAQPGAEYRFGLGAFACLAQ